MKRTILAFAALILLAVVFWSSAELQAKFDFASGAVNAYVAEHEVLGAAVFILFGALSAVLSPFSSIPAVPFAVAAWGKFSAFLLLLVGWSLGAILSYGIGKYGIRAFFERFVSFKKADAYQRRIPENSKFLLVVLFRLALPSEATGLVLGSLRYHFPKYMAATVISEIPFAVIAVYMSGAVVFDDPRQFALWAAVGGGLILLVALLFLAGLKFWGGEPGPDAAEWERKADEREKIDK